MLYPVDYSDAIALAPYGKGKVIAAGIGTGFRGNTLRQDSERDIERSERNS